MDFKLTPEQEALKKELDDFLREEMKNAPPGWEAGMEAMFSDEGWPFHRYMARRLSEKGWLVRPWPREYGGVDAPMIEQVIFSEVMGYHRAPGRDIFGIGMIGPTLLVAGNEEQKKEHLPPIARAERFWCQGWSEPNAGSDLASLTTRAVRDGDDYIINGQKTWTSGAHFADWSFILARTNPEEKRSRGISFFLVDMKSPGVTVRPLLGMNGTHLFNEVYYDDVRVPARNRVGEENEGWAITRATMNFERSSIETVGVVKRELEELAAFCKETKWNGKTLSQNPFVRHRLAQLAIEIDVGRALAYRTAWLQEKGGLLLSADAASAAKVYGTELAQRLAYTGYQIMGLYGQVKMGSKWAPLHGSYESSSQLCMGMNLAGGSSEVQRNMIAWFGLGLPRTI
ncbi:MAG: acyl-CoA dehydrogenase family protein [Dehalococcoidia bacterium]|nr:acyl-CoA dehydrogenase family protein [Dehalococcoidia bacterium]